MVVSASTSRTPVGRARTGRRRGGAWRLVVPLWLAGCGGDAILDRADEIRRDRAEAAPAAPTEAAPAEPAPAAPAEAAPAAPAEPAPVTPADPQPVTPAEPEPVHPEGPTRELRGVVEAPGWKGGPIRVDVFDGDQQAAASTGQRPRVVAMADLAKPGPFRVAVPTRLDRVWVGAFADENANGRPDAGDLAGWYADNPVVLEQAPEGLGIVLEPVGAEPPPE